MNRLLLLVLSVLLLLGSSAQGLTVIDEGGVVLDDPVSCGGHTGRVVVRTGCHIQLSEVASFDSGVSIAFHATSGDALDCCWLQFVWAEIVLTVSTPQGVGSVSVAATVSTTGGDVTLTTNPAKPSWHVDSASKSPCYEVNGASIKTPKGSTMFDRPGFVSEKGSFALPAGWTLLRVEERKHFEAYLVCNRTVCHRVAWDQVFTLTPPAAAGALPPPPPTITGPTYPQPSSGAVTALRPDQRAVLGREHPGQSVLP